MHLAWFALHSTVVHCSGTIDAAFSQVQEGILPIAVSDDERENGQPLPSGVAQHDDARVGPKGAQS